MAIPIPGNVRELLDAPNYVHPIHSPCRRLTAQLGGMGGAGGAGWPGGISPPGSHRTERDSLPSLRSSHP